MTDMTTETPTDIALLPCPFCGGEAKRITPMGNWKPNGPPHYKPDQVRYVCGSLYTNPTKHCTERSAFTGDDAELLAIAAWNTRADAAELETLRATVEYLTGVPSAPGTMNDYRSPELDQAILRCRELGENEIAETLGRMRLHAKTLADSEHMLRAKVAEIRNMRGKVGMVC